MTATDTVQHVEETTSAETSGRGRTRVLRNGAFRVAGLVALVLVWHIAAVTVGSENTLPGPLAVLKELGEMMRDGNFFEALGLSVRRVAIGFVIAFVIAFIVGLALARSEIFEAMFGAYVFLGLTVPGLAYAVICIILFGLNETAATAAVVASIVPLLILNIWEGAKAIDRDLLHMSRVVRASRVQMIRHVYIPSLTPYLLAGTRLGLSLAWKLVVVVELVGLSSGVGYELNRSYNLFNMSGVLAWTLGFSLAMALLEFGILRPLERYVLRWRPKSTV